MHHVAGDMAFDMLPATSTSSNACLYVLEVCTNNFMSIVILTSREQLEHIAMALMTGIYSVFPADIINGNEPISEKELFKGEGQCSLFKMLLCFDFNSQQKQCGWRRKRDQNSSPSYIVGSKLAITYVGSQFWSSNPWLQKLRHAFTALPGVGAYSHCATVF
jgi:hypothetical protein